MTTQTEPVTAAGTKLYMGGTGSLGSESSWTEIGDLTNFGEFGRVYQKIEHKPVGSRGTEKFKGGYDDGALNLDMARTPGAAGQAALLAARDSDNFYNFKIELNDNPAASSLSAPSTMKFKAAVFSYTTNVGTRDGIVAARAVVEIQSGTIVETPAA